MKGRLRRRPIPICNCPCNANSSGDANSTGGANFSCIANCRSGDTCKDRVTNPGIVRRNWLPAFLGLFLALVATLASPASLAAETVESATEENAGTDKDEYLTIYLEPPRTSRAEIICATPGNASAAASAAEPQAPEGWLRIYSFGKPVRVTKSYQPNHAANREETGRSIAQILAGNVPELAGGYTYSSSQSEKISNYRAGLYLPVSEQLAAGLRLRISDFRLDDGTETGKADLYAADLGVIYALAPEITLTASVLGTLTGNTPTPGARLGAAYANRSGVNLSFLGEALAPWADNTLTAANHGRTSGLRIQAGLPLPWRLRMQLEAGADWRTLADGLHLIDSYQGVELRGQGRLEWALLQKRERRMPGLFREAENLSLQSTGTAVNLYTNFLVSEYYQRPEQTPVPVTARRVEQRFGLDAAFVLNSHLGVSAACYTGYDTARKISIGKLYGFDGRLLFAPTAKLLITGDFGMDNEAATGIAEGSTWRYGGGVSVKF